MRKPQPTVPDYSSLVMLSACPKAIVLVFQVFLDAAVHQDNHNHLTAILHYEANENTILNGEIGDPYYGLSIIYQGELHVYLLSAL